jgi:hypothetical protein
VVAEVEDEDEDEDVVAEVEDEGEAVGVVDDCSCDDVSIAVATSMVNWTTTHGVLSVRAVYVCVWVCGCMHDIPRHPVDTIPRHPCRKVSGG